jgi:cytochrome c oxidase subunit II
MDAIPGHPNLFWLKADVPGTYMGTCSEYCGDEHAWMRILVIAEPERDFLRWTESQLGVPPAPPAGTDASIGAQLFLQQLTCANCHAVAGTAADGTIGPDLTHIASRRTLAAGRLENSPANLFQWLSNPQAVKPGVHMPNFQTTSDQVRELSAYLESLQ